MITDHQALVSFLKSRILNKRLRGWMLQLLDFEFDADALSRQAWSSREEDPGMSVEDNCKVGRGEMWGQPT